MLKNSNMLDLHYEIRAALPEDEVVLKKDWASLELKSWTMEGENRSLGIVPIYTFLDENTGVRQC